MSGAFDTEVVGEPAALRHAAQHLLVELGPTLARTADRVAAERAGALAEWSGAAAEAFAERTATLLVGAEGAARATCELGWLLDGLAGTLETVLDGMAQVREQARAQGLPVTGTVVSPLAVAVPVGGALSPREAGLVCVHDALRARADELRAQWEAALDDAEHRVDEQGTQLWELCTRMTVGGWSAGLVAAAAPRLGARSLSLAAARDVLSSRWAEVRAAAAARRLPPSASARVAEHHRGLGVLHRGLGVVGRVLDVKAVHTDVASGEPWWQAVVSQGASIGTSTAVTGAGAWLGGGLGALAGPVGAVGGAAAGGAAAAGIGTALGARVDQRIDAHLERDERARAAAERERTEQRIRSLLLGGEVFARRP
ncbi:hypothetical protein [Nocardioides perillae]|uniref:Uncharacterized protein YukE n=1 Tax=Nocardioides perillae TaxID=1119534 RepID=A0A7Y9RUU2_9ACTN|nr:hypothetical protein [Nocardioides perillae]NYG54992.1 uncharacterized protein YukE [Nocardioides perillae]